MSPKTGRKILRPIELRQRRGRRAPNRGGTLALALAGLAWLAGGGTPPVRAAEDHDRGREAGGRSPGGLDPRERLRRFDANGDGILTPDEVPPPVKAFLAERLGVSLDKPMSIEALAEAVQRGRDGTAPGDRSAHDHERREPERASAGGSPNPLVPGFGVESELLPPPGFDVPLDGPLAATRPLKERYSAQVLEHVESMLRRYDKNKNDVLDPDEWKDVSWRTDPKDSDLNHDGRLTKVELCERIAKFRDRESRPGSGGAPSGGSTASSSAPAAGGDSEKSRLRGYAESLLRQYDENKNGRLERDEWGRMRGSWQDADRNRDGVLTLEEIADRLATYSSGAARSGTPGESAGGPQAARAPDKQPPRRFLTPTERLPSGLPAWFARADLNGDGQVALAEFSPTWNSSKNAEFAGYDLNGDGLITAAESLAAEKRKLAEDKK